MPNRFKLLGSNVFSSGNTVPMKLEVTAKLRYLFLRLSGTLAIAGGTADGTVFADNPLSIIRNLRIFTDGQDTWKNGPALDWRWRALFRTSFLLQTAVTSGAVATTNFESHILIPFELPVNQAIRPIDGYLDAQEHSRVDLEIQWGTVEHLIVGGDRTKTLTVTQLDVYAYETQKPSGIQPHAKFEEFSLSTNITATETNNDDLTIPEGGRVIYPSFILEQTRNTAPLGDTRVDNIINNVTIFSELNGSDRRRLDNVPWGVLKTLGDERARMIEAEQVGLAQWDFREEGRLSYALDARSVDRLEFNLDVTRTSDTERVKAILDRVILPPEGNLLRAF